MLDIAEELDRWVGQGRDFAVATVVSVSGSAPRRPGAALAVDADGTAIGSVSGGCVEGAVYELCRQALEDGEPVLERFGYSDDDAFAVGLTCGGIIDILVTPVRTGDPVRPVVAAALKAAASGAAAALARVVSGPSGLVGRALLVRSDGDHDGGSPDSNAYEGGFAGSGRFAKGSGSGGRFESGYHDGLTGYHDGLVHERDSGGGGPFESGYRDDGSPDPGFPDPRSPGRGSCETGFYQGGFGAHPELDRTVAAEARAFLDAGRTGTLDIGEQGSRCGAPITVLVESSVPAPRMIVFGAIDFAAALVRVGKFLNYHVTVCDARPVFATADRFPEADEIVVEWPHQYLERTRVDARTVLCVLTHDAKFDVPLLRRALRLPVAYVGAMGSRRTHLDRNRRLREAGVTELELARLRSPIGLDLGARTPEETALSIAAEIVAERRGGSGVPLTGAHTPIHHDVSSSPAGRIGSVA
ncbi:XdhC family protein [Streptomyces rishiriensis]|uniref:XdhC family protein n=1 Tax=Streptomyces rishiriensis TaxID=68264 RepID=UPI0037D74A87